MAQSLGQFSTRMAAMSVTADRNVSTTVRKAAIAAGASVVVATPVDTGRARSNWIATVDVPSSAEREPFAPGEKGSTGGENAQQAIEEIGSKVAAFNHNRNRAIYLTNNLPYIQRLNEGSSNQAPANFVEKAVQSGANSIRGVKILSG